MLPVSQPKLSHPQSPQILNLSTAPSLLPLPKPFTRQAHPPYCSLPTKPIAPTLNSLWQVLPSTGTPYKRPILPPNLPLSSFLLPVSSLT